MRFLAVLGLVGVVFAGTSAHAIVVKDKSPQVKSNYDKPAVSSSQFLKADRAKPAKEHYSKGMRTPERKVLTKAPKKQRTRGHVTEWP